MESNILFLSYSEFSMREDLLVLISVILILVSLITLICSVFGMVLLYLYPIFSTIYFLKIDNNFLFFVSLFSTILMTISIIPTVFFYKLNFLYFFSLPLSSIIYIMMTITSALNFYFKKGNVWKGRKY